MVNPATMTPADVRAAVNNSDAWGALMLNAGANAALMGALASPAAAATYDPTAAMTVVWDEARNPQVSPRVGSVLKALAGAFGGGVGAALTGQVLNSGVSPAFVNASQKALLGSILAHPVAFTEESQHPFTAPVLNLVLLVGQIICAGFPVAAVNDFAPVPSATEPVNEQSPTTAARDVDVTSGQVK